MAFIYDNLIATVVSLTVLLILASIQMSATSMSVSNSSRNVAITQAETFGTWVEEELSRVGRNLEDVDEASVLTVDPAETNEQSPEGVNTPKFTFQYATFEGGSPTTHEVAYMLCPTDEDREVYTRDGVVTKSLFQLRRQEDPEDDCDKSSADGVSPPALGYFYVQRLTESLDTTSSNGKAELLRVKYSVIAPFQGENTVLQEVHRSVVSPFTLEEK
jgi:hypothetical protein